MADQGTQSHASSSSYQRDNSSQGPNYRFQHPQMRAPDNLRGPELNVNFLGLIPFDSDGGGWQDQAPSLVSHDPQEINYVCTKPILTVNLDAAWP
jgi:hypothetical protein